MPRIELQTFIKADKDIVFDLARSIDLHKLSTEQTKETAIAGKTSGLIELDESVTWKAKHFGVFHQLTSKITEFKRPDFFVDEMVSGIFKSFRHEHHFKMENRITLMIDIFLYEAPLNVLGKVADSLFLRNYMTSFLEKRNMVIKETAESNNYQEILNI